MEVTVRSIDFDSVADCDSWLTILNNYALDVAGGGTPIDASITGTLISKLKQQSIARVYLACINEKPVGLANCFMGFSTFAGKPLLNIHDIAVLPKYRGGGVGKALLDHISERAKAEGCCKVTLEVLEGNIGAQRLYRREGFAGYDLGEAMGKALFWQKKL